MKIGPKFKIAKRLGAPVFEKTQSQKFALSQGRGGKTAKRKPGQMSDYKRQLIEKQKMRYVYGLTEKQLRRYVDEALVAANKQPVLSLVTRLEERLDNVVYRLGFAKTRRFARQMVSHGHITVNGIRLTVPSYKVKKGDTVSVREGSKQSPMYLNFGDTFVHTTVPMWLKMDPKKLEGTVEGAPQYNAADNLFDPEQVFEFYSR